MEPKLKVYPVLHMMTATSRNNEHSPSQPFLLGLQLGMKILCQRNVSYVPGRMLQKQSRTKPAERCESSAFGHQTLFDIITQDQPIIKIIAGCMDGNQGEENSSEMSLPSIPIKQCL